MNASEHENVARPRRTRLKLEVIVASACAAFGFFVLPGLIYWVGAMLLGPYGVNRGLGAFYADFFRDLAEPAGRTWIIGLGPLAIVTAMRAVFIGSRRGAAEAEEPSPQPAPPARRDAGSYRVEPRIGPEE